MKPLPRAPHSLAVALIAAVLLALLGALSAAHAAPAGPGLVQLGDQGIGTLLLKTVKPGFYVEAPRVATDVEIDVAGPIVRARVTQRFTNPSDMWVEGVYVFPLPEDSGVDTLKMIIGDRFIEGIVKEKQEARAIYEEAKAAGKKASLVEQERPNIFTNAVANIGPGETVVVQIEYQDIAVLKDGVFSLRFPMVVGPRYIPEPDLIQMVDFDGSTGLAVSDPVPDAGRISPPVMHPDAEPDAPRLPVFIQVDVRAGFPLGAVKSSYHGVQVERLADGHVLVGLEDGAAPANKDFVLEWTAADGKKPHAALFKQDLDGETYLLAMVTPPATLNADAPRRPREAIFVIDNSGSMAGPSMPQAKQALLLALDRLEVDDLFNVIRFDDTYDLVFPRPVAATRENVAYAKGFVANLEANGGTEMLDPLRAALRDLDPGDDGRVRQVIFLTDGAIGNESQLFEAIDAGLGRSRLFTVGIGSAPNSYFMTRAARLGRGTFTHIGDVSEVADKAGQLFQQLERPVMTDLTARFPAGVASEIWPDPLPDLYAGEPVIVTARASDLDGKLRIAGDLAGTRWAADLDLAQAADGNGVAVLWARSKIAAIEETRFTGGDWEAIDKLVLATALDFSLVTRLTSLVAVDVTPSRPAGVESVRADVPTMLPDGWDFDKVFGTETGPILREARLTGDQFGELAVRNAPGAVITNVRGVPLPQGAALFATRLWIGLALLALGLAGALAGARRRSGG